jgi:hypothetical protein
MVDWMDADMYYSNRPTSQGPLAIDIERQIQKMRDHFFPPQFERPKEMLREGKEFAVVFSSRRLRRQYRKAMRAYGIRGRQMETLLRSTRAVLRHLEPGTYYVVDTWRVGQVRYGARLMTREKA